MEQKFEDILNNYINGNRKDAKKAFEELTGNELHNFTGWMRKKYEDSYYEGDPDRQTGRLFYFVLFLAC